MPRLAPPLALLAAALLSQSAAQASKYGIHVEPDYNRPSQQSSNQLRQTVRLESELESARRDVNALSSRLSSIQQSIKTARRRGKDVESMINSLRRLDDKVKRIKRELDSATRIPQLRMVKPLAKMLGTVHSQLHSVRKKADQMHRDHLKPLMAKLKKAERKVAAKVQEVRSVSSQIKQAQFKLGDLRRTVATRGYNRLEVSALESAASAARPTIGPARQVVSQMTQSLSGVDRSFNTVAQQLSGIAKAKRGVDKLDRDLAKADKAARDLNKVLSKRISIKFPKKFSISIRQLLEAPGKVIDVVLKPLMKLAEKALNPVLKKFKINLKLPREIAALPGQLNQLRSMGANLNSPMAQLERAMQRQIPRQFTSKLNQLTRMTPGSLRR